MAAVSRCATGLACRAAEDCGLKDRDLLLAPADETFCDALEDLLRSVDYRHEAESHAGDLSGLLAWEDFHRDRAEAALMEGLDL
jgi:hypothetical protein